jgi:GMP synthase-like glutamine amidotransferase
MILIIDICSEALHYYEFVRPIEEILRKDKFSFQTLHYSQINKNILDKATRVIICGTSLKDNEYLNNIDKFLWLKKFKQPVLGICAGMQIIGSIFNQKIDKNQEIGFFYEKFTKNFFSLNKETEVYHLHNNYIKFNKKQFDIYNKGKIIQAIRKKRTNIYACLFHPEVRNQKVISKFAKETK